MTKVGDPLGHRDEWHPRPQADNTLHQIWRKRTRHQFQFLIEGEKDPSRKQDRSHTTVPVESTGHRWSSAFVRARRDSPAVRHTGARSAVPPPLPRLAAPPHSTTPYLAASAPASVPNVHQEHPQSPPDSLADVATATPSSPPSPQLLLPASAPQSTRSTSVTLPSESPMILRPPSLVARLIAKL